MCASPLEFLRAGPPPPRIVLLPDALFFARAIPVIAPAEGGENGGVPGREEVERQAELALEGLAPFPVGQLYHGFYWRPGASRALVFAAYRRRLTAEQTADWPAAEVVAPAFTALLGAEFEPATSLVLTTPEGLTVIHWDHGPVPSAVWFQPFVPETPAEERQQARDSLLRRVESRLVVDLTEPPVALPSRSDREMAFRSGERVFRLPAEAVTSLDVRDKGELVHLRRGRKRDLILWRVAVACAAAAVVFALGEAALFAGGLWQRTRRNILNARAPAVERIMTAQEVANRINDLSSKRLLPLEMIHAVNTKRPPEIQFLRAWTVTDNLNVLMVEAQTPNAASIGAYKGALETLPSLSGVEVKNAQTRNNMASFTLVVTFKAGSLQPSPPPS